jgi:hypothetical protein
MKLLGRFSRIVADEYEELLTTEDVDVSIEDTVNTNERDKDLTLVTLYVPEESYEKAVSIIKNFEKKSEVQLNEDSREANRVMFNILMVIIFIVFLLLYLFKDKLK